MNIVEMVKRRLFTNAFVRNFNDLRFRELRLFYDLADLTPEYYELIKEFRELEHQIGRLQNFRRIINEIKNRNLPGDIAEFGTWRGFGLLWIAFLCQKTGLFDRAIMGIDGFVGLQNDDGDFKLGQFSDVSRKVTERNLKQSPELFGEITRNISIHQSLFEEKARMNSILRGRKFVFINVDCDVSSAALVLFDLFKETDCLADECHMLFDDYGCESSLKETVEKYMKTMEKDWQVSVHSQTNLTKNFHLIRR